MSPVSKKLLRRNFPEEGFSFSGISPWLSRIYYSRGITNETDLEMSLSHLLLPDSLKGIRDATELLKTAVKQDQSILIVGDFDADGATSTALMLLALRQMGAKNVDYLVPNRFEFGYGLTPGIVKLASQESPDLIVTVDNGISSNEGVLAAKDLGIKVLITDHHLPGKVLPSADAIVNPNQPGCEFPDKSIAGVGVAFYILSSLRRVLREENWFEQSAIVEPAMASFLDLVALGTIADVVKLDANNRILAQEGLKRIRSGKTRPGIKALWQVAGKSWAQVSSMDLAFQLAPRLNAAGRLDDMSLGIECLITDDVEEASQLAQKLDGLNRERREIEKNMRIQAEDFLDLHREYLDSSDLPMGVCIYHDDWHQGVVGILASRLKEKLNRPVIAFAKGDGREIKGSARSIPQINIRDLLDTIASQNPELLSKFGGHAMAAGLTLTSENYERFKHLFDLQVRAALGKEELVQTLVTDGELSQSPDITEVRNMLMSAPWGHGFPEPLYDGVFQIVSQVVVGANHLKMKLKDEKLSKTWDAIAFNVGDLQRNKEQRMTYRLGVNEYNGNESLQLLIEDMDLETRIGRQP